MIKSEKIIEIIEEKYKELVASGSAEIILDEKTLGNIKLYLEQPKNVLFSHELKTQTESVTVYVGGDIL